MDESLANHGEEYIVRCTDIQADEYPMDRPDARSRLYDFLETRKNTNNLRGHFLTTVYLKYDEHLRAGRSEFQAARPE